MGKSDLEAGWAEESDSLVKSMTSCRELEGLADEVEGAA